MSTTDRALHPLPLGILPPQMMRDLRDRYGLKQFVETGTASGRTAMQALAYFDQVTTCELSFAQFCVLKSRLPEPPPPKRLILLNMDSPRMLRDVFANPGCLPALVWLDAHYCGGPKLGPECPLLDELRAVGGTRGRHVILIDDARLFVNPPPPPHDASQWPTIGEIRELCERLGPTDQMDVIGDIICVTPCQHAWVTHTNPSTPDGPAERIRYCSECGTEDQGD